MTDIQIGVVNTTDDLPLPKYETRGAAGLDLLANIEESIVIEPGERRIVPTNIKVAIPVGYEMQVRPRSGLAAKHGITVLNAPGTIDSDYRGVVGVILINLGTQNFTIKRGDKIAQGVFAAVTQIEWYEVGKLSDTERGEGGFGSTTKPVEGVEGMRFATGPHAGKLVSEVIKESAQ